LYEKVEFFHHFIFFVEKQTLFNRFLLVQYDKNRVFAYICIYNLVVRVRIIKIFLLCFLSISVFFLSFSVTTVIHSQKNSISAVESSISAKIFNGRLSEADTSELAHLDSLSSISRPAD
jgi:hypothetical protein